MEESFYHEYAAAEDEHWWFEGRRAIIRELLGKWLPPRLGDRRKILDVGCGPGGMLDLLMELSVLLGAPPVAAGLGRHLHQHLHAQQHPLPVLADDPRPGPHARPDRSAALP